MYSNEKKEVYGLLGTMFLSGLLFIIIGKGNLNFALFDDNQAQWLPIIDKAYQTLLHTGKLPTIDFFQMKGMKIYDQGYYGLWNPFMLIAYLVRTYLLSSFDTNTISVYIFMMIVLGNICCYKTFRKCGVYIRSAILFSGVLMSVSVYVALSYWYYIYNVYFILSWLLLRMVKQKEKQSYYEYGAILSLSLLMGNVQYTVYMYLAFALLMIVLFLRGEKHTIGKLFSNSIYMGVLSFVPLLLLLQASLRTANFSQNNAEYYNSAVHPLIMALFSWIPDSFLGSTGEKIEELIYSNIPLPDVGIYPGARCVYMGVMVCAVILFLCMKKKYQKDRCYEVAYAGLLAAMIMLLLSFGKIGVLAIFGNQVPFFNSFRILAKYLVLIPPLLIPCVGIVVREQKHTLNKYNFLLFLFFVFGVIHNRLLVFDTVQIQQEASIQRLGELGVDYKNYRILGFASWQEIQWTYPQGEDFSHREKISYEEKFSKNTGTTAEVLTLGGYDLAFDYEQFQMSDSIMGTVSGYAAEFGYDNMIIEEYFLQKYNKDNLGYWSSLNKLREQIIDNSMKYFIFTKDSACYPTFMQILEDMHMPVEWQQDFFENTVIISIEGACPLVADSKGGKIDANVTMDKISFGTQGEQEFRIGMYYDKGLRAFFTEKDGQRDALPIFPDEKGYILVSGVPDSDYGIVEIDYHNKTYILGQVWNILSLLVIVVMLFAPATGRIRSIVLYVERKIKIFFSYWFSISPEKGIWICFKILLCLYVGFLGYYYLHTQCTVPDEDWFLHMFNTIRHNAKEDFFVYFGDTENYLGYAQIYWILGSLFDNILVLRIIAYIMLLGSMVLTLWEVRERYGVQMVPFAGILWITMPFAWYSDKIIGPELSGLFLGILGLHILRRNNYRWIGWLLLGVSGAVKLYYMIFLVAALLLEFKELQEKKLISILKASGLSLGGFILANPIMLWDLQTYTNNMSLGEGITMEVLAYVFERRERVWDVVMVNGVFWGYVSAFLLFAVIVVLICKKTGQRSEAQAISLKGDSHFYGYLTGFLSLPLIIICCRERFLGWYLLPLCYLLTMFVCNQFDYEGKVEGLKNMWQWMFVLCLLINGVILLPEHISNRQNNITYVQTMNNRDRIQDEAEGVEKTLQQENPDTQWYYLLDFHMDKYSYNSKDFADFCLVNAEGICIIGERMRYQQAIEEIIQKAIREEENLYVLWQTEDVWVIQRRLN